MNESEQQYSIGPLMKAARKFKKLNQADVAQAIGCSQSALSKMEHNLLIPSAPQWFLFARFTAIAPEALETGIIDRHSLVKFNSDQVSLGFKIPKKYRQFRSQKVRQIYPFFKYLESISPGSSKEFIESTQIESEFFLDFDNLINFQLFLDAIEAVMSKAPEDVSIIVREGQDDIYWDGFFNEWKKLKGPKELLAEFCNAQSYFQADFVMKLEYQGSRLIINVIPEKHLQGFAKNINEHAMRFLTLYRKYSIEFLVQKMLDVKVVAEPITDTHTQFLGDRFEIKF